MYSIETQEETVLQPQEVGKVLQQKAQVVKKNLSHTINGAIAPKFESWDEDTLTYLCSFEIKPEYANPMGVLHGGLTAYMLDTAMGHLSSACAETMTPTITMNVSYLLPIPIDQPLFVQATINRMGSNVAYLTATAFNSEAPHKLLATATGAYMLVKK